ncbi:MAG: hypothetical protein VX596_04290 [Pseudomonadota bacterium]|nr:hypothetical protein [Pseudomonadota bacterium]
MRDEVTNLRAARTRDREQIAETMVGLLRHLTDMGAALSTVEEDVTKLRQTADQLARRPVPPPAARILAAFVRCRRQTSAKVPAAQDYPASSPKITA